MWELRCVGIAVCGRCNVLKGCDALELQCGKTAVWVVGELQRGVVAVGGICGVRERHCGGVAVWRSCGLSGGGYVSYGVCVAFAMVVVAVWEVAM